MTMVRNFDPGGESGPYDSIFVDVFMIFFIFCFLADDVYIYCVLFLMLLSFCIDLKTPSVDCWTRPRAI